eukprot:3279454-Lingulodinium_polyedra.AAC.1
MPRPAGSSRARAAPRPRADRRAPPVFQPRRGRAATVPPCRDRRAEISDRAFDRIACASAFPGSARR